MSFEDFKKFQYYNSSISSNNVIPMSESLCKFQYYNSSISRKDEDKTDGILMSSNTIIVRLVVHSLNYNVYEDEFQYYNSSISREPLS